MSFKPQKLQKFLGAEASQKIATAAYNKSFIQKI